MDAQAPNEPWIAEARRLGRRRPHGILFLCVANSARSQMAEGIAASLAPEGVRVQSAGSRPTRVRPEAIAALAEIGLDISGHESSAVADVDSADVEAVITLCADEVCPAWLGDAVRLHWALPDPDSLDGFRAVRDELRRRLGLLFASWEDEES